jgi:hypothetical protein
MISDSDRQAIRSRAEAYHRYEDQLVEDLLALLDAQEQQLATVTAERDDARRAVVGAFRPRLNECCPTCGGQTLIVDSLGLLVCSWLECREPGAAHAMLERRDLYRNILESDAEITSLRAQLEDAQKERDRWKEDSHRQAQTIQRMATACEDRNIVDAHRDVLHKTDLAERDTALRTLKEGIEKLASEGREMIQYFDIDAVSQARMSEWIEDLRALLAASENIK